MTALNFLLTRALARELEAGDEVLVTRLDHDGNVAPWLALAEDIGIVVRFVDVDDDLSLDLDDLAAKRSPRTRVVAFPAAANSVGTAPDVRRVVELAHEAGALAWVDAVHYGPHGPIDVVGVGLRRARLLAVQVLRPAHGPRVRPRGAAAELAAVQGAARGRRAGRPPLRARHVPARAPRGLRRRGRLRRTRSAGTRSRAHERALGQRFLDGLPGATSTLHGLPTMEGRVPTFCFSVPGRTAQSVAEHLAERDVAVWWGNYYALETMRLLGLDEVDGAVRAGIVHYNTAEEVDRLLAGVAELRVEAPPARRPEVRRPRGDRRGARARPRGDALQPRHDRRRASTRSWSGSSATATAASTGLRGREWDAVVDTSGYLPRVVGASARLLADAVGHYVFVSSISVYASFAEVVDEGSPLAELTEPGLGGHRGATTARSRRSASARSRTRFPGRSTSCAPG